MKFEENIMIRNEVTIDKQLIKELSFRSFIFGLLVAIVGLLTAITMFVLAILNSFQAVFTIIFIISLSVGAIGAYHIVSMLLANRRAEKMNAHLTIDLFDDKVVIHTTHGSEKAEDIELTYDQITLYHVSKTYIFLRTGRRYSFPLSKDENMEQIIALLEKNGVVER